MRLTLACAFGAALLAGASPAQPSPPKQMAPPSRGVFLSPSGEPFRPSAAAPDPLKAWFDQADAKHLGYLDRDAFRADAVRFFHLLDENNDGVIDGFEVADYERNVVPEFAAEAEGRVRTGEAPPGGAGAPGHGQGGQGGGGGHRHGGEAGQGSSDKARGAPPVSRISQLIYEPEPVSDADYNFDSHITLDEWLRAADERFDLLDRAKTGKLTLDELRARFKPLPKN